MKMSVCFLSLVCLAMMRSLHAFSPLNNLFGEASREVAPPSLLSGTQWKIRLDVGLQPGTWMPKRHPGWAESGARLGLDVNVEFTSALCDEGEALVGPKQDTLVLNVTSSTSTFVSERGQETVEFKSGGYCIQRPTASVRNAQGGLVQPEGLLRFWLDCPSGAKRRDVEIFPNTRIFFTTGVWDDPVAVKVYDEEYRQVLQEMKELVEKTKAAKAQKSNFADDLIQFRSMVQDSKMFERLKGRKQRFERELPPFGSVSSSNGVQMAPSGSLVIKGNKVPDWLPGSEYLILGTFTTSSLNTK